MDALFNTPAFLVFPYSSPGRATVLAIAYIVHS
jgi:hypothetical protein